MPLLTRNTAPIAVAGTCDLPPCAGETLSCSSTTAVDESQRIGYVPGGRVTVTTPHSEIHRAATLQDMPS